MNKSSEAPDLTTLQAPATSRQAAPPRVTPLACAEEFRRLAERRAARCRRHGQAMSALSLQLQPDSDLCEDLSAEWLVECTRRLCGRVRSSDIVVCWAAHHHGVLLLGCNPKQATAVLRRLTVALSQPYGLGDRLLHLRWQGSVLDLAMGGSPRP